MLDLSDPERQDVQALSSSASFSTSEGDSPKSLTQVVEFMERINADVDDVKEDFRLLEERVERCLTKAELLDEDFKACQIQTMHFRLDTLESDMLERTCDLTDYLRRLGRVEARVLSVETKLKHNMKETCFQLLEDRILHLEEHLKKSKTHAPLRLSDL